MNLQALRENLTLQRAGNSATLMSWLSVASRASSVLLVIPLVVRELAVDEIALWYLFATLIGLQQLADLGFAPTFVRVIAFAVGGSRTLVDSPVESAKRASEPQWDIVERIWQTMLVVYHRLTLWSVVLFAVVGSLSIARIVRGLAVPSEGWLAWTVIIATFAVSLRSNAYAAYLQGVNQVALLRKWESIFAIGSTISSVAVLLSGGGLLGLVIANQSWVLANAWRNRWLALRAANGRARQFSGASEAHNDVLAVVWGSAIRSGVGVILSRGVIFSSGIIYAQVASVNQLAAYLLAFRVCQAIIDFASAPFYSKLPELATLRSQGRYEEQLALAERGMRISYWVYVAGVSLAGALAPIALPWIRSNAEWVPTTLWALMALAFFVERFGAMHIQLYSTTNKIIWHIANGVSGSIYLLVSFLALPSLGVYAFPIGILVGYLAFYSWYGPMHVRRAFSFDFWEFQRRTVFYPMLVLLALSLVVAIMAS